MSPHETLFIEATNKIVKNDIANSSFVQFEVWDFPGHVDTSSDAVKPETTYGGCVACLCTQHSSFCDCSYGCDCCGDADRGRDGHGHGHDCAIVYPPYFRT